MAWTWTDIERDWLGSATLAVPAGEVVAAFALCEHLLGRQWVEGHRWHDGIRIKGTACVIGIVGMGQRLAALQNASGLEAVLEKIRDGDFTAKSELTAAYLCAADEQDVKVEFEPEVTVRDRHRKPDFRVRKYGQPWTWVEVTAPDVSEVESGAREILNRLLALLTKMPFGTAGELLLRRAPTKAEMEDIVVVVEEAVAAGGLIRRPLHGLGLLLVGHAVPGEIHLESHGEPASPRISVVRSEGRDGMMRQFAVRLAISDERADAFLTREARQLPKDEPGLVMMALSRIVGGRKWGPLLSRRFQPTLHTRVSGVVLFSAGSWPLSNGEAWVPYTELLPNPHAALRAPEWLFRRLASWTAPDHDGRIVGAASISDDSETL
jgi:hypothetical protein